MEPVPAVFPHRPARAPADSARAAHRLQVNVRLDLRNLSRIVVLALAAVIEDENARLSYWALKHASPKPDFHHPDAFVLELA
jgi:hypothetical protein